MTKSIAIILFTILITSSIVSCGNIGDKIKDGFGNAAMIGAGSFMSGTNSMKKMAKGDLQGAMASSIKSGTQAAQAGAEIASIPLPDKDQ